MPVREGQRRLLLSGRARDAAPSGGNFGLQGVLRLLVPVALCGRADAHGVSIGKTLPAIASEPKTRYPKKPLTAQNAAEIPCEQVLGSYVVRFERG